MRRGRPTKITPNILQKVSRGIQLGNFNEVVAVLAGISPASYYSWLKRGKEDMAQGRTSRYTEFLETVLEAEAQMEVELVSMLHEHLDGNPKLTMDFLSRRFPERWSKRRNKIAAKPRTPMSTR